jgi:hypothetical protein
MKSTLGFNLIPTDGCRPEEDRMRRFAWAPVALAAAAGARDAGADERKFTYSNEAKTLPAGSCELEQWVTMRLSTDAATAEQYRFREELEVGLLDRLTAALYLNWRYTAVPGDRGDLDGLSGELKFKLLDGAADPVGLLLYAEVSVGSREEELELKLVLDKQLGDFRVVYNLVVELVREEEDIVGGTQWINEAVLKHTFGASWQLSPNFAVGLEGFFRQAFDGILAFEDNLTLFLGPNVHVAVDRWWATFTIVRQVPLGTAGIVTSGVTEFEFRIIIGVNF